MPAWKRALDLTCIFVSLPALLPIGMCIALWIKLVSRGPVLFRQTRIGRGGEPFTIFKFRSMEQLAPTDSHESHVQSLVRSDRPMTKLDVFGDTRMIKGALFLRMSGFDELPQLLNVIRGDMSIVGPRPCVPKEFKLYGQGQKRRFAVHPGLTGFWQVNGKNRTTFSQMVSMDEHYVGARSLGLDLGILIKTPLAVAGQLIDCIRERIKLRRSRREEVAGRMVNGTTYHRSFGDSMTVTQKLAD